MQRTQRAFAKNVKERKERNVLLVRTKKTQKGKVLLQKNAKEHITLHSFEKNARPTLVLFFNIYIYIDINRYIYIDI